MGSSLNDYQQILELWTKGEDEQREFIPSDNDNGKSVAKQLTERDTYYTEILKNHKDLTQARGILKEVHKWVFFWLVIIACIISIRFISRIFNVVLDAQDISLIIDSIPLLITGIVSLISTIIAIPLTIAQFLFNTKEDDNIAQLIQHTQDHDTEGMKLFKDRFGK